MDDRYQNVQEFIDDCNTGMDIEFFYNDVGYGVYSAYEHGPLAYRQDPWGYEEQVFKDAEDLLDNFIIEGKTLREIITEIELNLH